MIGLAVAAIAFWARAATVVRGAIFLSTAPAFFALPECPSIEPGVECRADEGDTLLFLLILGGIPFLLAATFVLIRAALVRAGNYSQLEYRRRSTRWALSAVVPIAALALTAAVWQGPMALLLLAVTPVEGLGVDVLARSPVFQWSILVVLVFGPIVTLRWPRLHALTSFAVATFGILIAEFTLVPTVLVLYAAALTMSGVHGLCIPPPTGTALRGQSAPSGSE